MTDGYAENFREILHRLQNAVRAMNFERRSSRAHASSRINDERFFQLLDRPGDRRRRNYR